MIKEKEKNASVSFIRRGYLVIHDHLFSPLPILKCFLVHFISLLDEFFQFFF